MTENLTPAPTLAIPGPHNIVTDVLSNGLRVWVYENFESATISLSGYVPGGSVNEGPGQKGLADLTAAMLRRGTLRHDFDALNELVEGVGASFSFDAGHHVLGLYAYALAEDFPLVLDLLAESLIQPAFPADELEKTRVRFLTQLQEQKHSTRAMAMITSNQLLYPPDHPYRLSLDDEIAFLQQVDEAAVARFYREKITPRGGVIVVVGAIRAAEVLGRLERALGPWRHPHARPDLRIPPRPTLTERKERRIRVRGKSQSDVMMGWPGISRTHPDYFPMLVCNGILGQFGMGGRIGRRIRQELGLAYYAYSSFNANRGPGLWRIAAGVNPANVAQAVAAMEAEVARIIQEPVSDEELADVQSNRAGSLPLRLETNRGIGRNLLMMAWYDLGMDYLMRYGERIRAVDKEAVQRVARTYLHPQRYALAVAGPQAEEA